MGNVFRDLGLPDAEVLALKADLAVEIFRILKQKKWTQATAADALGIDQPQVSRLKNADFDHFSVEQRGLKSNRTKSYAKLSNATGYWSRRTTACSKGGRT